ncbi:hypothetical protein [Streptomyces sp. NPDC050856]|uniref:hypothetical protein n=1 Tax=Streptomyces sp. NPDC050856 TaxID=3154939 RepID=UPI0033D66E50
MNQPPPDHQPYPSQQPHPQPPGWGTPPPEPKKSSAGKIAGIGCLGVVALVVVIGAISAAVGGGTDTSDKGSGAPATTRSVPTPAEKAPAAERKELSQTDQFKAFVAKSGTAAEKAAAKHVTRVQGAGEQNNVLDAAEIHTDYTGGLLGPHGGDGKLLASVFAEWKTSKNGLVTVYDGGGEILANGKF